MSRKSHWEHLYESKSPDAVSWYQAEPTLSLELIARTGVSAQESIIDVGGGASRLVDRLYAQGFRKLAVLDISANALLHARQRLGEAARHIEWFEADITEFSPPHPFDLWHDRAVFHFLTAAGDRARYVEVLRQSLRPGGHLIIAAFAIGGPTKCSGLDIVQYDSDKLAAQMGKDFCFCGERTEVHVTPAGKEQQFGYFRFVRTG